MIKIEEIKSPVDGHSATRLVKTIPVEDVIKACDEQIHMDVARYFEGIDNLYILECKETGYRFYYPFTTAGSSKFYEETQDPSKENFYRKWGYDYQFAYDLVQPGEKVLDIGCGTGEFIKRIQTKTHLITGLELNSVAFAKCKQEGLNVFRETSEEHLKNNKEAYDVVCFFQVLEHVYDVKSFLDAALGLLKPGGKLIIGVPNNEPYIQRFNVYQAGNLPPHHMGMWNKKVFSKLQSLYPLKLEKVIYDEKLRWSSDAYYRAKLWMNLNEPFEKHSKGTKMKLLPLMALAAPFSFVKHMAGGINGSFIGALFTKTRPS